MHNYLNQRWCTCTYVIAKNININSYKNNYTLRDNSLSGKSRLRLKGYQDKTINIILLESECVSAVTKA